MRDFFHDRLLEWYNPSDRPMPWKNEKDPYLVWLSEIILQQTRVQQGTSYYNKFKKKFPTITSLASAQEKTVLKLWEGLGYYSRARNLHETAKHISKNLNGVFPDKYDDIIMLKGVGPYTAAAVSSFAFGLPYAVVDGNVYRILSRVFGVSTPIDTTQGKKEFATLAQSLIKKETPGIYNQAIMDFGSQVCTPQTPNCESCPFEEDCYAYAKNEINILPVKVKKLVRRDRYFNFIVFNIIGGQTFIEKRIEKDIWQGLFQFPLIETKRELTKESLRKKIASKFSLSPSLSQSVELEKQTKQTLSHQKIISKFWKIEVKEEDLKVFKPMLKIDIKKIDLYPLPKSIDWYLKDK